MKTARRQAREIALQALYAWQLSGSDPVEQARSLEGFDKTDSSFVNALASGVRDRAAELERIIAPHLDRGFARLSPIERAILYIGAFELAAHPETPFKVVLNEAIELGKSFGATDGHRFVNGVLEKIAVALRPDEVARSRKIA
jgi:N utilization substance protein B